MFEKERADLKRLVGQQETWRRQCINLIASEQVLSETARALLGSDFHHRYAEGHPGERYYQGTDLIDKIEDTLKDEVRTLFKCLHTEVRPISGTNANEAIFSQFIQPGDIVLTNSIPAGGHISHQSAGSVGKFTKNIVAFPYTDDGYRIDVEKTKDLIKRIRPKVVVFGRSLFLFPEPLAELRDALESCRCRTVYDAAHVLGLVAGGQFQKPLDDGIHVMSGSTHKTYPGPQRGIVCSNLDQRRWREIDKGCFPGSSSNHHLDTLAPMLMATYEMRAFGEEYAAQVVANAKTLAVALDKAGLDVECAALGYTQSHQVAVDVSKWGGGSGISRRLRENDIVLNMNLLPHERLKNHDNPAGVRIGVQEMTRFGMKEAEMEAIAQLMAAVVKGSKDVTDEVHKLRANFQRVVYSFDE